jgi:hypothetical protein
MPLGRAAHFLLVKVVRKFQVKAFLRPRVQAVSFHQDKADN